MAERPIKVTCRGVLPFSSAELLEAIHLRLPLMRIDRTAALPAVHVQGQGQGQASDRVAITVAGARRVLSIKDLSGAEAARIVALLALDLVLNQQRSEEREVKPEPRAPSDLVFVGVSPRLTLGVSDWSQTFEPTLDLGLRIGRRFFLYIEGGFTWIGAGEAERELNLLEVPVRAGVAYRLPFRFAWFEARAGGALRPYFVSGAGRDSGVLAGGGVSMRIARRFSAWLLVYLALGVDFFTLRKAFSVGGEPALTTGWVTPWLGLGAGWEGGSW
jgi:hypothetical protein